MSHGLEAKSCTLTYGKPASLAWHIYVKAQQDCLAVQLTLD